MRHPVSPLEFLLVNAICLAGGALAAIAIQLATKAAYAAGKRSGATQSKSAT
jgi:hypothetical protein